MTAPHVPASTIPHQPIDDRPPESREIIQQQYALRTNPSARYGPATWRKTGVDFLYQADSILVREKYLDAALANLNAWWRRQDHSRPEESGQPEESRLDQAAPAAIEPLVAGVRLLRMGEGWPLDAMDTLRIVLDGTDDADCNGLGRGAASLNHFVTISGNGGRCAPVEPTAVPPGATPDPPLAGAEGAGECVRVVVLDTGLDPTAAQRIPWLAGVTGEDDLGIHPGSPATLDRYAGHGTFVAGVLRSIAPAADVVVLAPFTGTGEVTEAMLTLALDRCVTDFAPDVISVSAGTYTLDNTGALSLRVFAENLFNEHPGVALVCAAGNDAWSSPVFYPAGFGPSVAVGALNHDGVGRAPFSNFGGWVDVSTPGVDLVNAFPEGTYAYVEPPRAGTTGVFTGMAQWSGTSFSTPVVAGLIAARMSQTGQNARDAAADLLLQAQGNAQPGVGAVLMP
jgi:subtilisin family serine protease